MGIRVKIIIILTFLFYSNYLFAEKEPEGQKLNQELRLLSKLDPVSVEVGVSSAIGVYMFQKFQFKGEKAFYAFNPKEYEAAKSLSEKGLIGGFKALSKIVEPSKKEKWRVELSKITFPANINFKKIYEDYEKEKEKLFGSDPFLSGSTSGVKTPDHNSISLYLTKKGFEVQKKLFEVLRKK